MLLSYENEAILARQSGADFDYVVPDETLLIENPGAVTTDAKPAAKKFLDLPHRRGGADRLRRGGLPPARRQHRRRGRGRERPERPVPGAAKTLLTIDEDFGGWAEANTKFFDEDDGLVTKIQKETGKES